ncbi:hypothetical protein FOC4_g10000104 [Fusarium odoratissimum]|uniref:Uncharacterized protein n=1 Tax=Fusarium oxysporum f. sp. cubense (strain race 4) TaxID=2502994 RepID=N1RM20_FUSC4|nr:hypothetical protein FOC4_g10000104 [Fusarium odoratissimum]
MAAATSPSPPPFRGAIAASLRIWFTREVKQTFEQILYFDVDELLRIPVANEPWKSCYVPTGQIEPKTSDWGQTRGIREAGQIGRPHEVSSLLELSDESWEMVVLKPYFQELEISLGEIFPGCHFDPIYDPTEPTREDVERLCMVPKIRNNQRNRGRWLKA